MENWYEHPKYITDEVRTLKPGEAAYALREAWKRVYGQYPSDKSLAVLWAKSALETGHWAHIHDYNFGNIKRKITDEVNLFTMYECGEEVSLIQAQKLVAEDPARVKIVKNYSWADGTKRASIVIQPGHQWSQFVAHLTPEDGAEYYIKFVSQSKRYLKAWQKVVEGDPSGYSHELKVAGYYTANEAIYTAGVVRLFNEFMKKKDELMSWHPEPLRDTDPAPPLEPHDTEVDNPLPEVPVHEELPDLPDFPVHHEELDTDVDHEIPEPPKEKPAVVDAKVPSNGRMTVVMLVVASLGGLVSWILQSCQ